MSQSSFGTPFEIGLLVLLSFLWGASFTLIEIAIDTVPPATIVLGRLAIGATLLVLLAIRSGAPFPRSAARWGALLIQGILQSALPFTLISWGQTYIDSGIAGLLNTTPPLFVFLIGFFLLGDRVATLRKAIGIALGFGGVIVIMGPATLSGETGSILGMLAVSGASLSYALAALYARRFSDQPPVLTAACSMAFAAVVMLPVSFAVDSPMTLSPTIQSFAAIVALGLFSTALAMVIYFRLVRTLGPLGVTTGSYMRAGFSIVLGILLLGEALSPTLIAGLLMIFAGVAIVTGHLKRPLQNEVTSQAAQGRKNAQGRHSGKLQPPIRTGLSMTIKSRSPKILVSACLLGQPVRYNGKPLTLENETLAKWQAHGFIVPFCPEISAGFTTPRPAAEIEPGRVGPDVLAGNARVFEQTGGEVTDMFATGARLALARARSAHCEFALLADGSPSCGSSYIFSGRFDGEQRAGIGVVSALLKAHGIQVFAQHQVADLEQAFLNRCRETKQSVPCELPHCKQLSRHGIQSRSLSSRWVGAEATPPSPAAWSSRPQGCRSVEITITRQ